VDLDRGHQRLVLRDYLRVVARRKWVVVLVFLLLPALSVLASLQQPARYQATADVLLNRGTRAQAATDTLDPSLWMDPVRVLATQARQARLSLIADRTLRNVGIADRTAQEFLSASSVTPDNQADVLVFGVTDGDPALAARLVNEYARQFTRYRREFETGSLQRALGAVQRRLAELRQAGETDTTLYESLAEKEEELNTLATLQTQPAVLLREAKGAAQTQPRPVRNGVLAAMLGLFLGVGVAFLWEVLDTRVRSAEEVSASLHLPLLARIPEPPRRFRGGKSLATLVEPHGVSAEPFRMLRTNFELANLDVGARTILFTSGVEEEGKSTTVANLAVSLARAGRHVVLVDLDLRRAALARFFGLHARPGLTDVALGRLELGEAIRPITLTNGETEGNAPISDNGASAKQGRLEVLTSGRLPPEPGEFAESRALTDVLLDLWKRGDYVLIDAPPLLRVHDAMALSSKVDALVVVTRLNVLRRPMLNELHRILASSPVKKLGFVLTGVGREEGYDYTTYDYDLSRRGEPAPDQERVS
jgi:Mrp family chromosome partitioning ATPase/capsular polysaccharide biosynthesis protein